MNRFDWIVRSTLTSAALVIGLGSASLSYGNISVGTDPKVENFKAETVGQPLLPLQSNFDSPPSPPLKQSTPSLEALEQAIHTQINQYRREQGLPLLTLDARISQQARTHSQTMAQQGTLNHDGFSQRIRAIAPFISYSSAAENVAYNQGYDTPDRQAVRGWLDSPGHLENIEGRYNLTGIGVAKNRQGEYFFTQIFIRSR